MIRGRRIEYTVVRAMEECIPASCAKECAASTAAHAAGTTCCAL